MTRITNEHRSKIRKDVLAHRYTAAYQAIQAEYAKLAREIYEDVFSKKDRDLMESLPKGWMARTLTVKVQLGSNYEQLAFSGVNSSETTPNHFSCQAPAVSLPVPADRQNGTLGVYEATAEFSERYEKLAGKAADLRQQEREAAKLMDAVLDRTNTLAQLLKAWPEVEPFVGFLKTAKPKLPALPINQLNGLLDLPVDKAA